MVWIGGMTRADMAESVDHAKVGENPATHDDIFDDCRLDAGDRNGRSLGTRRSETGEACEYRHGTKAYEPPAEPDHSRRCNHCHLLKSSGKALSPAAGIRNMSSG